MSKIKKTKSKGLRKKGQSQGNTKKIVLKFDIKIDIAKDVLKKLLGISTITLFSFAISSCNNIGQQPAANKIEQTNVNAIAINVEKIGANIR